ncbi:MAG: hypothetical protein EA419_06295 [Wenzhouxiangella sp.]|nr:MAG: hypothetical protein EA419_06295 [Wenzhouxiangella sp.]
MQIRLHDIRLLAGFEIQPGSVRDRTLTRDQASELAGTLAADLARAVPSVDGAIFAAAGTLMEPAELLRPGLPAWSALADLTAPMLRDSGGAARVIAIGSHHARMPDQRLAAPDQPPRGQFLTVPLMLRARPDDGPDLEARLENELFERGSVDPPARALLERFTGLQSVHGQLLTLSDLMALQHVQLDAAGLSAFWPVIEQALIAPDQDATFDLPAGLHAQWSGRDQTLDIAFLVFDRFPDSPDTYPLWQRAFRTLTLLASEHGLAWRPQSEPGLTLDEHHRLLIHSVGPTELENSLTEQVDPDAGLIAWTVVEDGLLRHLYPLDADAARQQRSSLLHRFERIRQPGRLYYSGEPACLQPMGST